MDAVLPSPDRVREILDDVRQHTVDGMVVADGRNGYPHAVSRERIFSHELSEYDHRVTSVGRWLLYRLLQEYIPHNVPIANKRKTIEDLGIFSGYTAFRSYYDGPQNCAQIHPEVVEKSAERFSQGDEGLREELKAALQIVPEIRKVQPFKKHCLCAEPKPRNWTPGLPTDPYLAHRREKLLARTPILDSRAIYGKLLSDVAGTMGLNSKTLSYKLDQNSVHVHGHHLQNIMDGEARLPEQIHAGIHDLVVEWNKNNADKPIDLAALDEASIKASAYIDPQRQSARSGH